MDTVGLTDTKWALDIAAKPVTNANQDTRKRPPGTTQMGGSEAGKPDT